MGPPMEAALEALQQTPAKLKHVIMLTDGISEPADFEGIAQTMAQSKITCSTVAVGDDCDFKTLQEIARIGNGRYYHSEDPTNRFSIKSGWSAELTGVKVGSFWSGNPAIGLPRHNSTIVLLDQRTGRLRAVIEAGKVNAYRTAAADAVAADLLARKDARTLAVFGSGNQAGYEIAALARIRPIEEVLVVSRPSERLDAFVEQVAQTGLNARAVSAEEAVQAADIVVTATPSREPLFDARWVRPGTHVVSMGSDGPGKHELPTELYSRASLFCDLLPQSVEIGDFQHARRAIEAGTLMVTQIGDVIEGRAPGRRSDEPPHRWRGHRRRAGRGHDDARPGAGLRHRRVLPDPQHDHEYGRARRLAVPAPP